MNGKKFVIGFLIVTTICGAAAFLLMKRAFETRPLIKIEEEKKN